MIELAGLSRVMRCSPATPASGFLGSAGRSSGAGAGLVGGLPRSKTGNERTVYWCSVSFVLYTWSSGAVAGGAYSGIISMASVGQFSTQTLRAMHVALETLC